MGNPTFFVDESAITGRTGEQSSSETSWANGMNPGASNAPGIGINIAEGAVVGTLEQFTLADQDDDVRVPQVSQPISGEAWIDRSSIAWPSSGGLEGKGIDPIQTGTNPTAADKVADPAVDGDVVKVGTANLQTLSAGWVETAI